MTRCQSSILADPTGFAGPKWVLSSFANSDQLWCHVGVRHRSSSSTPCSNHSNAIFLKWLMVKKTLVVSVKYCCGYELKVIWHCSKNTHRASRLDLSKVSGAWMWDWLVIRGLGGGGGMAIFWLIASSACTSCWTGSVTLVDNCTKTGGDCCRVGGLHELHDGGAWVAVPPGP